MAPSRNPANRTPVTVPYWHLEQLCAYVQGLVMKLDEVDPTILDQRRWEGAPTERDSARTLFHVGLEHLAKAEVDAVR